MLFGHKILQYTGTCPGSGDVDRPWTSWCHVCLTWIYVIAVGSLIFREFRIRTKWLFPNSSNCKGIFLWAGGNHQCVHEWGNCVVKCYRLLWLQIQILINLQSINSLGKISLLMKFASIVGCCIQPNFNFSIWNDDDTRGWWKSSHMEEKWV